MKSAGEDNERWACRVAERLPAGDVSQLARAAAEGVSYVRELRARTGSPVLRNVCDQLLVRLAETDSRYIAGLLAGASCAVERAHRHQTVDVVWTGPESGITTSRLTAATVIDLIGEARQEILLVSFATQTEPTIGAALQQAAARGVTITLLTERQADNPAYAAAGLPFPGLAAIRLSWPGETRPRGAALHAKVIVVDDRIALVGSANLTSRAMEDNLECGILIHDGPHPRVIRRHIDGMLAAGYLRRILSEATGGPVS